MIILNQSKDSIVNFDNVIEIVSSGKFVNFWDINDECGELGEYPDSVRAREVVEDIFKKSQCHLSVEENGKINYHYQTEVYEMPEE